MTATVFLAPIGEDVVSGLEPAKIEAELRMLSTSLPEGGPIGTGVGVDRPLKDPLEEYVPHVVGALEGRDL